MKFDAATREECEGFQMMAFGLKDKIYRPETINVCLSAGWGPISYRLHMPESIDYWHWNPNGRWTDEANQRGYFVGSSELGEPIRDSFGYSLAHRGCTHNSGTDRGYSISPGPRKR
jgi:hypothetical protein